MSASKEPPPIEVLTFDCYGTLIDWESGLRAALRDEGLLDALKMPWDEFVRLREKREAEWEALPYRHYREIVAITIRETFASFQVVVDEPTALRCADSIARWPAFPDTVSALRRLGSHYPLAIISNVDRAPLHATIEKLGIPFAEIVTAEDVRAYKPSPVPFTDARRRLGSRANGQLHVAASPFHDLEPCAKLAIPTAWVNRRPEKLPEGVEPRFVVKDLLELCKRVGV